jgi:thioredoxin-related protein
VLNQVAVQRAYREHFAIFKLSVDSSQMVTDVDGEVLSESALAKKRKVFGTPYTLVISGDKSTLGRLPGAPINSAEFLLFREYLLAGGSQHETFAQYKVRRKGSP